MKHEDFDIIVGINSVGIQFIHTKELLEELGDMVPEFKTDSEVITSHIEELEEKLYQYCKTKIKTMKFDD